MKDDFSTLMPGHELVIKRARAVCSTAVTDKNGRLSLALVDLLDSLESAVELLDAGDHERALAELRAMGLDDPPAEMTQLTDRARAVCAKVRGEDR